MSRRRFVTKVMFADKHWMIYDNGIGQWVKEHYNSIHFKDRKSALSLADKLNRGRKSVDCYGNVR